MLRLSAIALLAALGFAAFNQPAMAEDAAPTAPAPAHHGKEGRGERMHNMLFKGITLTDAQKESLEKLREEGKEEHKAERKEGKKKKMSKEERKAAMDKHLAAVRAILTDDQAKIFDQNVKQMEAKRADMEKKHGKHGKGGDGN